MRWLALSLVLSFNAFGQIETAREYAKKLCSPEMHGRGYVQSGDSLAASFIALTFENLGLKPVNGTYFQSFRFPVNMFPGKMEITVGEKTLSPGVDYIVNPSSGGSDKTLEIEYLTVEKLYKDVLNQSNFSKSKVYVFRNYGFGGDTLKKTSQRLKSIAKNYAVIELVKNKLTWSVSTETLGNAYIQIEDSVFDKSATSVHLAIDAKLENHTARNVMGFLPAKKKTNKTIILSAHYDHLGRMGLNTYFPGGNDNASGNAMLIQLIDYFRKKPLKKYNILFVAFAGEEIGLLGSKYMVEHPPIDLKNVRFLLNLDIMGSGEEGITVVNSTLFPKEFALLEKLNNEGKYMSQIKKRGPAANSDHYFFTEAGVPAFFFYTMGPNKHYHDVFDTYDELSFKAFENLSVLIEKFLSGLK